MPLARAPDPQLCLSPEANRHVMASLTLIIDIIFRIIGTVLPPASFASGLAPQTHHLSHIVHVQYVDTIVWPTLLPMPTCFRCYLLAHICCPHVLSDPTSQTHHSVYLPRSEMSRFRFSQPNAHGCKSVRFPAWTELSLPHCT